MRLSPEDVELFYKIQFSLFVHVNRALKLFSTDHTLEEIKDLTFEDKMKIRNAMWENDNLIDSFIEANPFKFDSEELELVGSWRRHHIKGRFLMVADLKSYTVFFEQDKQIPYGVFAIRDEFKTMLGFQLPIMVETVLLPFKDKIIYDGMINSYRITFGAGARRNINDAYQQAKAKHGIVTSLPFSPKADEKPSDEDLLKFYLKNERNREMYRDEIWKLTSKNSKMMTAYHQIMGRNHARHYGKEFRKMGINGGWFAILQGLIVASGTTEEEAEKATKKIVQPEKRPWVYLFHFKK